MRVFIWFTAPLQRAISNAFNGPTSHGSNSGSCPVSGRTRPAAVLLALTNGRLISVALITDSGRPLLVFFLSPAPVAASELEATFNTVSATRFSAACLAGRSRRGRARGIWYGQAVL